MDVNAQHRWNFDSIGAFMNRPDFLASLPAIENDVQVVSVRESFAMLSFDS